MQIAPSSGGAVPAPVSLPSGPAGRQVSLGSFSGNVSIHGVSQFFVLRSMRLRPAWRVVTTVPQHFTTSRVSNNGSIMLRDGMPKILSAWE